MRNTEETNQIAVDQTKTKPEGSSSKEYWDELEDRIALHLSPEDLIRATRLVVDRRWSHQRAAEELGMSELEYTERCWDGFAGRPMRSCCDHQHGQWGVSSSVGFGLPSNPWFCRDCGMPFADDPNRKTE